MLNYSDVDPDPDGFWSARSGSRRAKMTHKHRRRKKWIFSFYRAIAGFSCSLDVLLGGLKIKNCNFFQL